MSAGPSIVDWTARELGDAAKMNSRIRDVHDWLSHPPAVRVKGHDWPIAASTYDVLPFNSPSLAGTYETRPDMTLYRPSDGLVRGLRAPLPGRYRVTLGAALSASSSSSSSRDAWIYAAVNAADSGQAIADTAKIAFCPVAVSGYTHLGTHTAEIILQAGDVVRFAAQMLGASVTWADTSSSKAYAHAAFAELRWVGEIP